MQVDQFRKWWFENKRPFKPPFKNAVYFTDTTHSLCIFRDKRYQVLLITVKPNVNIPKHSHPNVESCATYLTGYLQLGLEHDDFEKTEYWNTLQKENPTTGMHVLFGTSTSAGYMGEPHSLQSKDGGGAFLVFEKWLNDVEMTTALIDWIGEPIDEGHKRLLDENKKV
jgi:hypothetical protein